MQESQRQTREAQNKALEMQNLPPDVHGQIEAAQNQAHEAQKQLQEFQNKVQDTQNQLEEARHRAFAAEGKVREIQSQLEEIGRQTSEAQNAQGQLEETRNQVQRIQSQSRNARRLTRVFALLAVLSMLAASIALLRQRKIASQALAQAAVEATGKFDPTRGELDQEQIGQMLRNIGGAEQDGNRRRSLDRLAALIPREEIPEALKASTVIVNDQQRSHFQKWLLIRLGWVNPMSAMTCASATEGRIVNDAGLNDSSSYFQLAVLDNWMKADLPGALRWVCQLPNPDSRQRALEKIICWMKSQPDSESKNKALETGVDALAKADAPAALALAESLPEGIWRNTVIVRLWLINDSLAAWEWVNNLDLLQEIMPPQKAPLPGSKFLLNPNFGGLTIVPFETEISAKTTNASLKSKD